MKSAVIQDVGNQDGDLAAYKKDSGTQDGESFTGKHAKPIKRGILKQSHPNTSMITEHKLEKIDKGQDTSGKNAELSTRKRKVSGDNQHLGMRITALMIVFPTIRSLLEI